MNRNDKSFSALRQPMVLRRKICVTGENSLPVAALDNMDRISGGTESCTRWHRSLCLSPEDYMLQCNFNLNDRQSPRLKAR